MDSTYRDERRGGERRRYKRHGQRERKETIYEIEEGAVKGGKTGLKGKNISLQVVGNQS